MRWLLLFLISPWLASAKEVQIPCTTWFEGHQLSAEEVVIGEVMKVDSQVETSAAQVLPKESCILRIEEVIGSMPELRGVTTIKLIANHIHDTYQQLPTDWGFYRHLKAGQRMMALIHRYEGRPAIGSDALIMLTDATASMPDILKRTLFEPSRFTDADLAVVKVANARIHAHLKERVMFTRLQKQPVMPQMAWWLIATGITLFVTTWHFARRKATRSNLQ